MFIRAFSSLCFEQKLSIFNTPTNTNLILVYLNSWPLLTKLQMAWNMDMDDRTKMRRCKCKQRVGKLLVFIIVGVNLIQMVLFVSATFSKL